MSEKSGKVQSEKAVENKSKSTEIMAPKTSDELREAYPNESETIIEGLLRVGELMQVIGESKARKSWFVQNMGFSIATGKPFLGKFKVNQCDVLLIDLELEGYQFRKRIDEQEKIFGKTDKLKFLPLFDRMIDIYGLSDQLEKMKPFPYKVVILDSRYMLQPEDMDENSNADVSKMFRAIRDAAKTLKCAFIIVHHTSKGEQSFKSSIDVGSGDGSQARAVDAHLVLRSHKDGGNYKVMEVNLRSWQDQKPISIFWEFPIWKWDEKKDAVVGSGRRQRERRQKELTREALMMYVTERPQSTNDIRAAVKKAGYRPGMASDYLNEALSAGKIFQYTKPVRYSTVPPPNDLSTKRNKRSSPKAVVVLRIIKKHPTLSDEEVAKKASCSAKTVQRVRPRDI